jgi:hypothetical protein
METTINKNSSVELNQALKSASDKTNVGYELRLVRNDQSVTKIVGLNIVSDSSGKPLSLRALSYTDKIWIALTDEDTVVLYTP